MKQLNYNLSICLLVIFMIQSCVINKTKDNTEMNYTLLIHGGAGTLKRNRMTPEKELEYRGTIEEALKKGENILKNGGLAIEAVESVVKYLEDSPLFNAGKGSVFSHDGIQEMDASIMDGRDLSCGAVAGVTNLKNPIEGARIVKDSSKHVFLYGDRAQEYCISKGAKYEPSSYFFSEKRWKQYQRALKKDKIELDHDSNGDRGDIDFIESKKFGTVGCVALDSYGNLASATSTGGLTNKKYGRIGDSPIIGAGTYADNSSCAVSCTGRGEYFIRGTIARDISAILEYKQVTLKKAGELTLQKLAKIGGKGGYIAVDNMGNFIMMFNTRGMYRGVVTSNRPPVVKIYKDE